MWFFRLGAAAADWVICSTSVSNTLPWWVTGSSRVATQRATQHVPVPVVFARRGTDGGGRELPARPRLSNRSMACSATNSDRPARSTFSGNSSVHCRCCLTIASVETVLLCALSGMVGQRRVYCHSLKTLALAIEIARQSARFWRHFSTPTYTVNYWTFLYFVSLFL